MKTLVMILLTISLHAQAVYCPTTILRPGNTDHSFCHAFIKYDGGSYYDWKRFSATDKSLTRAEALSNCQVAKKEAMDKCLDYKRYDRQERGRCYVTSYTCRNYKAD